MDATMSEPHFSFLFKIDMIEAKGDATPPTFVNGNYKPPVRSNQYKELGTTGWRRYTTNAVLPTAATPQPGSQGYSTSVFYDGVHTNRFLFHPADCRTLNISDIEYEEAEIWGWRQLCFTEIDSTHCVLDLDGEFDCLCGQPGSYSPSFLPNCYRSTTRTAKCGLSGKMSLFLALTAFSCRFPFCIRAINHRLKIRERRWENIQIGQWGVGRTVLLETIQSHALTDR